MFKRKNKPIETFNFFPLPIPLEKNQKTVCPHCWFHFLPDDAFFISTHPHYQGKGKLNENEFKRFSLKNVKKNSETGKYHDPMGSEILSRACPRCELEIPLELLKKRPLFISITGAERSGKTYFLTTLLHQLKDQLPRFFNTSFMYSDSPHVIAFTKLEDKLFGGDPEKFTYLEKTTLVGNVNSSTEIGGIKVQLPKPFLFTVKSPMLPKTNNFQTFGFYDNAGEYFQMGRHHDAGLKTIDHLEVSDAIIFTFDPLHDKNFQLKLGLTIKNLELEFLRNNKKTIDQTKILQAVISKIRKLKNKFGERINIPLLVCVLKHDAWKNTLPNWVNLKNITSIKSDKTGKQGVDLAEIDNTSLLIKKFIMEISPSFNQLADQEFSCVRYFPVSALGPNLTQNTETKQFGIIPKDINSFRVIDPMLWLLSKYKVLPYLKRSPKNPIPSTKRNLKSLLNGKTLSINSAVDIFGKIFSKAPENAGDPEVKIATINSQTENRTNITFPDSGKRMELDLDYLDSIVLDPWSGAKTYIPKNKS